ncbi:hypothetical protein COCC4DRAFT_149291 [Bipolaris maydis ATCC 48331]|uniref:Hydrophobin n=2 Tax=Cochliobolus heterostrophus TaxID=5016 RepID=M2TCB9_COCH5|nr:uncharacterized protein COCC4DRAFT_149291 [Bipolaris maydis ATCC 48331]EMD95185.1 hypothetical protein COCHEDRAFT_1027670 [Bipolaris maydis C5]ENI00923.1 hypothetical protein COCC4DRAFT_149291 [Bipolaris maydis ATCC 48331]KAJ6214206.1 hypothetical protein PSV09DRAFT_1027670 [Bipolaris maydis]
MTRFLTSTLLSLSLFLATIHVATARPPLGLLYPDSPTAECCDTSSTWSSFEDNSLGLGTTYWAFSSCARIPFRCYPRTHYLTSYLPSRWSANKQDGMLEVCCGQGTEGPSISEGDNRHIPYPGNWCEASLGYVLCCVPAVGNGECRLNGAQAHYLQVNSMDIPHTVVNQCLQPGVAGWKYCVKPGTSW